MNSKDAKIIDLEETVKALREIIDDMVKSDKAVEAYRRYQKELDNDNIHG